MYVLNPEERSTAMNWYSHLHLRPLPSMNNLMFSGWAHMDDDGTVTDIVQPEGYNVADYFQKVDGVLTFLGPDQDGILPTFASIW